MKNSQYNYINSLSILNKKNKVILTFINTLIVLFFIFIVNYFILKDSLETKSDVGGNISSIFYEKIVSNSIDNPTINIVYALLFSISYYSLTTRLNVYTYTRIGKQSIYNFYGYLKRVYSMFVSFCTFIPLAVIILYVDKDISKFGSFFIHYIAYSFVITYMIYGIISNSLICGKSYIFSTIIALFFTFISMNLINSQINLGIYPKLAMSAMACLLSEYFGYIAVKKHEFLNAR